MLAAPVAEAGRSYPRTAGLEERFLDLAPDLLAGVTAERPARRVPPGRRRRSRCRGSTSTTSRPIRASVTDAVDELLDELPRVGRITLPRAHRRARRAARGRRALPRRARAVQAGHRRPRPVANFGDIDDHVARRRSRRRRRRRAGCVDARRWSTATKDERRLNADARAIEAIVMVAEEPVEPHLLAQLLEVPPTQRRGAVRRAGRRRTRTTTAASCSCGSPAATASRAIPTSRRTSSGSCSRASRPGCRPPRSRRWRSSPTSSRSPAPRSPPSAASTSTASMRTLQQRGYIDEIGRDPGPGQAVLFGTTPLFLERLGLDSLDDLPAARRVRARAPRSSRRSSTGLRGPTSQPRLPEPTASGCRRCSRRRASAAGVTARS